jgi:hypothetical protein
LDNGVRDMMAKGNAAMDDERDHPKSKIPDIER